MNRIIIESGKVTLDNLENIEYSYVNSNDFFSISELELSIKNNTDLSLILKLQENDRLIIKINIDNSVNTNLFIITKCKYSKIQYEYNLGEYSKCYIEKYNEVESIREMIVANLLKESNFEYHFKHIATNKENYDYMIYHKDINSISNIYNNGVNKGNIYYQISSFIPKKITGCTANQFNRIINLTNNKCEIRPNLYIDCDDVVASHSALIDKFTDNELFYLALKGIDKNTATKILSKGFLLTGIHNQEIIDLINKRYGGE